MGRVPLLTYTLLSKQHDLDIDLCHLSKIIIYASDRALDCQRELLLLLPTNLYYNSIRGSVFRSAMRVLVRHTS